MQARGWLGRTAEVVEAAGEPVQQRRRPARQRAAVGRHPGERLEPACRVEVRPVVERCVGQGQRTEHDIAVAPERRRARGVQCGQSASEQLVGAGA